MSNSLSDVSRIDPCNHEEADTRVLLHALDGSMNGYSKVSIVTVDTDVVVICLYHFFMLNLEELWIEFGVGKHRKYLPNIWQSQKLFQDIMFKIQLKSFYSLLYSRFSNRQKKR